MSGDYVLKILPEDGGEAVALTVAPKAWEIEVEAESLELSVTFCEAALKDEPEQYLALKRAWPGRETVELWTGEEEKLFSGKVSGVSHEEGSLSVKALSDGDGDGDGDGDDGEEPLPEVRVSADGNDPNRLTASLTADNHGGGAVSVDFGDGSPAVVNPGDGATATGHAYAAAGRYAVTVADSDRPDRSVSVDVTVPFAAA